MNRWAVAVGAILIQLALGAIYAWSVFTPGLTASPNEIIDIYSAAQLDVAPAALDQLKQELAAPRAQLKAKDAALKAEKDPAKKSALEAERATIAQGIAAKVAGVVPAGSLESGMYGFSKAQSQAIFSIGLACFAIVMVMSGRWLPKVGPRRLAMAGGLVLGLGYVLAGLLAGRSFFLHLVFIGVIGGSGIGLGYVVPIAVGIRWFPDKKGLITGLAVAGFGFGAFLWIKLADTWPKLIPTFGLPVTFIIYGAVFAGLVLLGSIWMKFPPAGWKPAGWNPAANPVAAASAGAVDYTSSQMLRTPQFYMIWVVFLFGAAAGLMTIGLAKLFPPQALIAGGMDPLTAGAVASTAAGLCLPIANGIGRIVWGSLSDRIGRKRSIVIMSALQGACLFGFTYMAASEWLLYVGAALIGFNFGGNFALFPAITADTFGSKYIGQNYGWVFLSYGVGGIGGPMLGGILGDMGNFPLAFTICGALCLGAAVVAALIRRPKPEASVVQLARAA